MTADSAAGRVVLDLGPGLGALVLYATADLEGAEIEISPAAGGERPVAARRTHALVRRRDVGGVASYAAVYQALAAGSYVIWRDRDTPAGSVVITGGEVTTWRLPSAATGGRHVHEPRRHAAPGERGGHALPGALPGRRTPG